MIKRKLKIGALLILAAATGGCSAIMPKAAPSETAAQQYGPYCEQLGNLKGTPDYDRCIKKMEDTYR
jgi:uncharacterized protein YceK